MNRFLAHALIALAVVLGGGSLLLFGVFLVGGPFTVFRLHITEPGALLWDALLSVVFFAQHSGMVRASFRNRLAARVPEHLHPCLYAIASGMALGAVVLLWQASGTIVYTIDGPVRLLAHAFMAAALAAFVWGARALRHFDTFGVDAIRTRLREKILPDARLTLRGPYLWVRHPLYSATLVMIWSTPDVTGDRLLFNVLWTGWIVLGAHLEERDLLLRFGEEYRHYQHTVPMLLPWRGSAGHRRLRS